MNMKLKNVTNVDKFIETVAACEGKVEIITNDGSRLDLKSTLGRYVALVKIFSNGRINQVQLATENVQDSAKMIQFMMNN